MVEPHIPEFADFHRCWKGKHVLDIGCGIGTDSTSFALAGAFVHGFDYSPRSVELAKAQARCYGVQDRCSFEVADIQNYAIPRFINYAIHREYDLLWSFGVLHHTPDPQRALAKVSQLAANGCELQIMLYHKRSYKALLAALGMTQYEAQDNVPLVQTFTRRQGAQLLRDCGWRVTDVSVRHVFPWRIKDYVQYRYRRSWAWWLQPLEKLIGWHLLLKGVKL
jgi:2-polyprenyl-3-methyl-5-hydroxy-6-metoxy-1,4-benzoquinol methylase